MKVLIFDLETSVDSPVSFKASPYWDANKIVSFVSLDLTFPETSIDCATVDTTVRHIETVKDMGPALDDLCVKLMTYDLVVGHNIQFDLAYMAKHNPNIFHSQLVVWDTKVVQHVLMGHQGKWTLDELCDFYGLPKKDDKISEFWKAGYKTEDIPHSDLVEYNHQDTNNTMKIFLKQLEIVESYDVHKLILRRNASRLATANIQFNGMYASMPVLETLREKHLKLKDSVYESWKTVARDIVNEDDLFNLLELNPGSPSDVQLLLYGGSKKVRVRENVLDEEGNQVLYKSGKKKGAPKIRWGESIIRVPSLVAGGRTKVDDSTLQEIERSELVAHVAVKLCQFTREYRSHAKAVGTYLAGMQKHIFPDSRIHSSYHHHVTRTGRLSSSSPNLQNVTDSSVKSIFIPKKKDHVFVEIDFNQLELRCVAVLSGDDNLLGDIWKDLDIHRELASQLFGKAPIEVTDSERRMAKRGTFQLLYGAGAPSIAKQWNMPVALARKFIDTFFGRYPGILEWRDKTQKLVKANMSRNKLVKSAFGTPYKYDEDGIGHGNAKFTQVINYPVQGLAAEVVHIALDKLYRMVHHYRWRKRVELVNCVHDSFLFEVTAKEHLAFLGDLSNVMSNLPKEVSKQLGIKFCLPLTYEVKTGLNWYDMEKDI